MHLRQAPFTQTAAMASINKSRAYFELLSTNFKAVGLQARKMMNPEAVSDAITEVFFIKSARSTGFTVNIGNDTSIFVEMTPPLAEADSHQATLEQGLKAVSALLRSVSDQLEIMPASQVEAI